MTFLQTWWRQPDHYHLLRDFFSAHKKQRTFQFFVAFISVALATLPLAAVFTPVGPHSTPGRVLSVGVATLACAMAALWLVHFPSRRQSVSFVGASALAIAISCTQDSDALAGLLGATTFAMLGGYVAIMHSARVMALYLVVAASTTGVLAARAAEQYGVTLAASKFALVTTGALAMPVAVQALIQYLGVDAANAGIDSLTGLLNRRAFERMSTDLARRTNIHKNQLQNLCVIMVDLDQFKLLNDTFGHIAGDEVLIAVSAVLRRCSPIGSVISRMGGEEFLVAVALQPEQAKCVAENIRAQIAMLRHGVTASVGIAYTDSLVSESIRVIPQLARSADCAMYEAKRMGGNRVICSSSFQ